VQPLLFDESAHDPAVFVAVSALVVIVSVVGSVGPARRATRADPSTALRAG
jgi:ABC-type antimicrobial peptide transport system permease subunit